MTQQPKFQRIPTTDQSSQERSIKRVAESVHRLNEAIQQAVESGLSIELVRVSRHHNGNGSWGDQMVPMIRADADETTAEASDAA